MKLTELFLSELDREVDRSRRALEQVPAGKHDWKPHEKSMAFGYLTNMVATIPTWITMEINQNELDVAPASGSTMTPARMETSEEYLKALDKSAADARAALGKTTDEHLMTPWRLLARGQVVVETARHEMIRDTINHWPSSRTDDGVPQADGCEGAGALWTVSRRQTFLASTCS
jgi:hypothetical protein